MGKKGKKGGGGGGGGRPPQADAPSGSQPQPLPQRQQQPPTPQDAPQDFPPPGAGGGGKKGKQKQKQQQQGGGRADAAGPLSAPQQQPSRDFPPPGAGGDKMKSKGKPEYQSPQEEQRPEPPYQPSQQYRQPHPQRPQFQQQQQRPQQQQAQPGGGPQWRGPRPTPPGFVTGQRPQEPAASFFAPPPQQGQPRPMWVQQPQPGHPSPTATGGPPSPWGQRGPSPPQQYQSRESTPTHQSRESPPTSSSSSSSEASRKQTFPGADQPPPRQQQTPTQPPPTQPPWMQQPAAQPPRQQQPAAQPPRQQQPATQPPWMQQPAGQPPRQQQPAAQPPRQQQPAAQPPRQQQPAAQPPKQQQPAAQPPRQQPQRKSPPGGSSMIPKRKDREQQKKKGREIIVETNHLALNIKNKNMIVCHYDVSVNPEKPFRIYRKALEAVRQSCYPQRHPAFDGKKNLYSYPELPFETSELVETVTVYDDERDQTKEVTVTIKFANHVDLSNILDYLSNGCSINSPQDAIQAIDIVLRQPAANRFVTVGRSFFTPPPGKVICLGDGLDLWYGFFQSAIIGWKPYLNIDVAHKGFPTPENCVEALRKIIRLREQDIPVHDQRFQMKSFQEENFRSYIKNLKVVYEIPLRSVKRTYKVTGLSTCARNNIFDVVDKETKVSTKTSVEDYFRNQYKFVLRYPHLPCIAVGPTDKPLSLPMELCRIAEGQVTMKKMNDIQTRNMVKEAAVDTERRKQKIMQSIHQIDFNYDPCLKEFGLSVADKFTKVTARILDAPTVDYQGNKTVSVNLGVWRNLKFLKGAELLQWRILNTSSYVREQELRTLGDGLVNHGKSCGMNISTNYSFVTKERAQDIERYFRQCQQEEVKLVIVVLPEKGVTYASVKKIAELHVGILTQCLKSATVKNRLSPPTFVNILQKVNAKLNGINHQITNSIWPSFFQRPVIVVGADVTHPAPEQTNVPSIAAVAASHDPRAFKYNMIWKLQPPREEVIKDLKDIMKEQLLIFYKTTGYQPQAILFYRDGVSEGQFKTILDIELMAIRQACSALSPDYKPPITFLVVQKRHHTRFFPDRKDADGRNKNVPAGTVVDTEITHPTELDFYLVSHASIQGTARPTKYHLLWDDSNMSEQDLEEITYYLCHLFTRCTRSVSYPAPTYYAHLAAFRARSYTEAEQLRLDQLDQEQNKRQVKVITRSNPMYFV